MDPVASEALYVTGDFSVLTALVDDPLMKARSFEDKLNMLNNLVRALAGEMSELRMHLFSPFYFCLLEVQIDNLSQLLQNTKRV